MIPILLYHRIIESDVDGVTPEHYSYSVTKARFESQMRLLSRYGFQCLSLDKYVEDFLHNKGIFQRYFVLTFDDGYREIASTVQPILKKYHFHATVFLIAKNIILIEKEKENTPGEFLSRSDVEKLDSELFSFGSHTINHVRLTNESSDVQKKEITHSKLMLEEALRNEIKYISYPYGSCPSELYPTLIENGYRAGCGVDKGAWHLYNLWRLRCDHINNQVNFIFNLLCFPYYFYKFREDTYIGKRTQKVYRSIKSRFLK